jgi:hypothetical protein
MPRLEPLAYREALRTAVSSQTKAYGFTTVVWTTGALLLAEHGDPGVGGAFSFLAGILGAMALVVGITFGSPVATWTQHEPRRFAFGAVHLVSVPSAVVAGWGAGAIVSEHAAAYGIAVFTGTLVYQLLIALEIAFSTAERRSSAR